MPSCTWSYKIVPFFVGTLKPYTFVCINISMPRLTEIAILKWIINTLRGPKHLLSEHRRDCAIFVKWFYATNSVDFLAFSSTNQVREASLTSHKMKMKNFNCIYFCSTFEYIWIARVDAGTLTASTHPTGKYDKIKPDVDHCVSRIRFSSINVNPNRKQCVAHWWRCEPIGKIWMNNAAIFQFSNEMNIYICVCTLLHWLCLHTHLLYKTISGNQMCSDGTCNVSTPP